MLSILITLIVLAVAAHLILTYIPMEGALRTVVIVIFVIIAITFLFQLPGIAPVSLH